MHDLDWRSESRLAQDKFRLEPSLHRPQSTRQPDGDRPMKLDGPAKRLLVDHEDQDQRKEKSENKPGKNWQAILAVPPQSESSFESGEGKRQETAKGPVPAADR